MKLALLLISIVLITPEYGFSRITKDVESYCLSLNIASPQDINDCMQFSQMCSFQMRSFMDAACGVNGEMEGQITQTGLTASSIVNQGDGFHTNSQTGIAACEHGLAQRELQKQSCAQMVEYCATGSNPNPSNGLPENFYATATTRSGSTIKITCDSYPNPICNKGREDLTARIPAAMTGEKEICDGIKSVAETTEVAPSDSDPSPAYTADEIVCKLLPTAEGCS